MHRITLSLVLVLGLAAHLGACSGSSSSSANGPDGPDAAALDATSDVGTGGPDALAVDPTCAATPFLRVVVLDVWGRRPGFTSTSATPADPALAAEDRDPLVPWTPGRSFELRAVAADLLPAEVRVTSDATGRYTAELVDAASTAKLAWSSGVVDAEGRLCPRRTLYIGLDHPWFAASGRAPTTGNQVDLFIDGASFWSAVHTAIVDATTEIRATTWWWQSDFELVRPDGHETMREDARRSNTAIALLEAAPARTRVLVARFLEATASGLAYMNSDGALRAHGRTTTDRFEVMLQGNPIAVPLEAPYDGPTPTYSFPARVAAQTEHAREDFGAIGHATGALDATFEAASFHQKAFAIDGRIAFVSGMNVKSTDWDTPDHPVFESRRMKFGTPESERLRVLDKRQLPDLGPRKDYGVRIEGPAATDVDDVLRVRWDLGIRTNAMFADTATPFELLPRPTPLGEGVSLQVVATLPPPIEEQSILDSWTKAIARAERFIYIEDQYFRMPILNELIAERLATQPDLTLVVITKQVTLTDGGKKYTLEADELFRNTAPDRYALLKLASFDAVARRSVREGEESAPVYFVDIDTHSKILVVDDRYLSVGSCNKNNRGLLYEGELNVAVVDGDWVRDARRAIYRNLVGPDLADRVTDDSDENFALFRETASANAALEEYWRSAAPSMTPDEVEEAALELRPDGFLYPLVLTPEYLLEVGPDAF